MKKKKKFEVELKITREYRGTIEVEAIDEDEAEKLGEDLWHEVETVGGETKDWEVIKVTEL